MGKSSETLFRYAINLHHQPSQMSAEQFLIRVARVEQISDQLSHQNLTPPESLKLQRRYRRYRSCLYVFLYQTDVEPTNNAAERSIRHSVVNRNLTYEFRSHWGKRNYVA